MQQTNHLDIRKAMEKATVLALEMVLGMALADQAASSTFHRTDRHLQGIVFHGNCTLEHHQLLTNSGCNHQLWCPHNSLGNLCNCQCSMTHTVERQFCKSLVRLPPLSLARPSQGSIVVVESKVQLLQQVPSSLLATDLDSSTPDNPIHHLPCKQSLANCMEEHQETHSNIPHKCRPCGLHSTLCILHKCPVCLCPDHNKVRKLDWHTGQLVVEDLEGLIR